VSDPVMSSDCPATTRLRRPFTLSIRLAVMAHLAPLTTLRLLNLSGASVSDAAFPCFMGFSGIELLIVDNTDVSYLGLKQP
jgi:hypothetical protein